MNSEPVTYGDRTDVSPEEIAEFYNRVHHCTSADVEQLHQMVDASDAVAIARLDGQLVGIARGIVDGVRGYLTECKLDPSLQGPAAVTRMDGRVEHDEHGIARALALRVLDRLLESGAERVDVMAWGTEVDFLEELGFRRNGGVVGMTLNPAGVRASLAVAVGG